ncbi:hypothetical protein C0992_004204 [Termitomyces sp. T32_za158]|nr:hypothetical protein C0992_004204 [Termitomyces sp. T32_za158]
MGASQSKSETDEHVFTNETPISFSHDVVNQLSDRLESSETSLERQSALDSHIRSKIQGEIEGLRQEEDRIRQEIELALEKENLDREKGSSEDGTEGIGRIRGSVELMGDLEEIRSKVDRYQHRKDLSEFPEVRSAAEAVVSCYRCAFSTPSLNNLVCKLLRTHSSTPLDCWKEVAQFKDSVALVEQQHFKALQ